MRCFCLKKKGAERVQNILTLVTLSVFENTFQSKFCYKTTEPLNFFHKQPYDSSRSKMTLICFTLRCIPCFCVKSSFKMEKPRICPWNSSYPGLCQAFKKLFIKNPHRPWWERISLNPMWRPTKTILFTHQEAWQSLIKTRY